MSLKPRTDVQLLPGIGDWGSPREPAVYRAPRKKHFKADPELEEACEVTRGAISDALEYDFTEGRLGAVLWQDDWLTEETLRLVLRLKRAKDEAETVAVLQAWGWEVFKAIQRAVLPEEYSENGTEPPGVCPDAGPRRAGKARVIAAAKGYAALAAKIKSGRQARAV